MTLKTFAIFAAGAALGAVAYHQFAEPKCCGVVAREAGERLRAGLGDLFS